MASPFDDSHSDGTGWRRERTELLATIARQQEESTRLAKRFKLLQRTLVDQQTLLERYQRALQHSGLLSRGASASGPRSSDELTASSASRSDKQQIGGGDEPTKAQPQLPPARQVAHESVDIDPLGTTKWRRVVASSLTFVHSGTKRLKTETNEGGGGSHRQGHATTTATTTATASIVSPGEDERRRERRTSVGDADSASTKRKTAESLTLSLEGDLEAKTREPAAAETRQEKPSLAGGARGERDGGAKESGGRGDASWISRKTDFHRVPATASTHHQLQAPSSSIVLTTSDASASAVRASPSPDCASAPAPGRAPAPAPAPAPVPALAPVLLVPTGVRRTSKTTTTWAQEKLRMQAAGIVTKRRVPGSRLAAAPASETAPLVPPTSKQSPAETSYKFVEVVRNREARAALPGHDCAECRKYYDALDGLLPDADVALAKAACSRHRARFEPYNTPDDFWRLSFPDSESPPLSP